MDPQCQIETPLYVIVGKDYRGRTAFEWLGMFPPEYLRPLISKQQATFQKVYGQRACVLTDKAPAAMRVRALSASGATKALSTTYTEDLYPDSPEQIKHKKDNGIPLTVTASVVSLKKYRPGQGLIPYSPVEGFRRRRFDPDHIRPLYWSARAAELAIRGAEA